MPVKCLLTIRCVMNQLDYDRTVNRGNLPTKSGVYDEMSIKIEGSPLEYFPWRQKPKQVVPRGQ